MEHRWGERFTIDLAVKIAPWGHAVRPARLIDLSISGGAIRISTDIRPLTRLQVALAPPNRFPHPIPVVTAYVTRKFGDCIGVEWSEFAPGPVREVLKVIALRQRADRTPRAALAGPRVSQAHPAANRDDIALA
jgi:hypothetical protein